MSYLCSDHQNKESSTKKKKEKEVPKKKSKVLYLFSCGEFFFILRWPHSSRFSSLVKRLSSNKSITSIRVWCSLPTEIIQNIFDCLTNLKRFNYTNYQLVSKQWYCASLSKAYKWIVIVGELVNDSDNLERLEGFYSLMRNSTYNIDHYVR